LLSNLMRVEQRYFVYHMTWLITGRFEITDTLAALILNRCVHTDSYRQAELKWTGGGAGPLPDVHVLQHNFTLQDFTLLVYKCSIITKPGKPGLDYADISLVFQKALLLCGKCVQTGKHSSEHHVLSAKHPSEHYAQAGKHSSEHHAPTTRASSEHHTQTGKHFLEHHPQAGKHSSEHHVQMGKHSSEHVDALVGRADFQILLDQVWKTEPFHTMYASPLHMCVELVQMADDIHLVDPQAEAANALEIALTAASAHHSRVSKGWCP